MADIEMSYGSYTFSPVPLLGLTKEYKKTEDGRIFGTTLRIGLEGFLVSETGGVSSVSILESGLRAAFNTQGNLFKLACNDTILLSGYPRINQLAIRNGPNNWVSSLTYNIDLEYDDSPTGEITTANYVTNITDNWAMEPMDDRTPFIDNTTGPHTFIFGKSYKLTHQIGALGLAVYSGGSLLKEPWQWARAFCSGNMGIGHNTYFSLTGNITAYNHARTQSINEKNGRYDLNESWLLMSSGMQSALEDFNINIKTSHSNDIVNASIQGAIHGLETISYGGAVDMVSGVVSTSKWVSAAIYWSVVSGLLFSRVNAATSGFIGNITRGLRPIPVSRVIGANIAQGTITYDVEYDNRPSLCLNGAGMPQIFAENVNFSYDYPSDIVASVTVLGRQVGPIIQLLNTRTAYAVNMAVDLVSTPVNSCSATDYLLDYSGCPHSGVKSLMTTIENSLYNTYSTVTKSSDKIGWSPKDGRYTRNVTWVYNDCASTGVKVADID